MKRIFYILSIVIASNCFGMFSDHSPAYQKCLNALYKHDNSIFSHYVNKLSLDDTNFLIEEWQKEAEKIQKKSYIVEFNNTNKYYSTGKDNVMLNMQQIISSLFKRRDELNPLPKKKSRYGI